MRSVPRARGAQRILSFLRDHPIVCLAILTPGIPEYLSTSSSLLSLVTNPVFFPIQLAINVGQYTAGALLIREAMIRWHKGWGTVFLLALAYGITEEGLGDNTLFNSSHGADGVLGWFGRYAGVNWVWATAVLAFHVILSIGLPILLLGLALPKTQGRTLLTRRGIFLAFASLAAATSLETVIVYGEFHFWMGGMLLVGSLLAITILVIAAYRAPADLWRPRSRSPTGTAWEFGVIGFSLFPIAFLLEYGFTGTRVPPALIVLGELIVFALLLERVRRRVGRGSNEFLLVDLAAGFLIWQSTFGLLLTLGLPYTIPLVILTVYFLVRLRRAYPTPGSRDGTATQPPPGVLNIG
jgi:hypothetical protein